MLSSGNQTIFIMPEPMAVPLLRRNDARLRVPPMQISASGRVICAKYSAEVRNHCGSGIFQ